MKYVSTRNKSYSVSACQAIAAGLAPDGGLFVPESIPQVSLASIKELADMDYRGRATAIMGLFLDEFSQDELNAFAKLAYGENYDCPEIAPTHFLRKDTGVLELWHGPTCAFKDMALQMLPHLLTASLKKTGENRKVCILVATSGDTGKAALQGFADVPGTSIVVFYPADGVSDVQKLQMTTQNGENVFVSAVEGNFDDAQTGVKLIFGDKEFAEKLNKNGVFLSSANSINWGRLLPQIVYYFSSYCDCAQKGMIGWGDKLDFCVPTGNFGDILAGWYAKRMGLPVGRLICASNSNNVLTDFINTGVYDKNREFYTTISPSMDILVSSNLERLLYMLSDNDSVLEWMKQLRESGRYQIGENILSSIRADFDCGWCGDRAAKQSIENVFKQDGYLMDPHTADAYYVLEEMRKKSSTSRPTVILSTASPFKFCDSVLSALGNNSQKPGAELIAELSSVTGAKIPKPLMGLGEKTVRFSGSAAKEDMEKVVFSFLSNM